MGRVFGKFHLMMRLQKATNVPAFAVLLVLAAGPAWGQDNGDSVTVGGWQAHLAYAAIIAVAVFMLVRTINKFHRGDLNAQATAQQQLKTTIGERDKELKLARDEIKKLKNLAARAAKGHRE